VNRADAAPEFIATAAALLGSQHALMDFVDEVAGAGAPTVARLLAPESSQFQIDGTLVVDGVDAAALLPDTPTGPARQRLVPFRGSPAALGVLAQAQLYSVLRPLPPTAVGPFLDSVGADRSPGIEEVVASLAQSPAKRGLDRRTIALSAVVAVMVVAIAVMVAVMTPLGGDDQPEHAQAAQSSDVQSTTTATSVASTVT